MECLLVQADDPLGSRLPQESIGSLGNPADGTTVAGNRTFVVQIDSPMSWQFVDLLPQYSQRFRELPRPQRFALFA